MALPFCTVEHGKYFLKLAEGWKVLKLLMLNMGGHGWLFVASDLSDGRRRAEFLVQSFLTGELKHFKAGTRGFRMGWLWVVYICLHSFTSFALHHSSIQLLSPLLRMIQNSSAIANSVANCLCIPSSRPDLGMVWESFHFFSQPLWLQNLWSFVGPPNSVGL